MKSVPLGAKIATRYEAGALAAWGLWPADAGLWDLDRRGRRFLDFRLCRLRGQLGSRRIAHLWLAGVRNDGIGHAGQVFHRS